jgi:hypothetical protein
MSFKDGVGDPRVTPTGRPLKHTHRHSTNQSVSDQLDHECEGFGNIAAGAAIGLNGNQLESSSKKFETRIRRVFGVMKTSGSDLGDPESVEDPKSGNGSRSRTSSCSSVDVINNGVGSSVKVGMGVHRVTRTSGVYAQSGLRN